VTFAELWNGLNQNTDTTAGVVLSQSRLYHLLRDTWITAHKTGYGIGYEEGRRSGQRLSEQKARRDAEEPFKKTFPQPVRDN